MKSLIYTIFLFSNFVFMSQSFAEATPVQANLNVSEEYAPDLSNVVMEAPDPDLLTNIQEILSRGANFSDIHEELKALLRGKEFNLDGYIAIDTSGGGIAYRHDLTNKPIEEGINLLKKNQVPISQIITELEKRKGSYFDNETKSLIDAKIKSFKDTRTNHLYCKIWEKEGLITMKKQKNRMLNRIEAFARVLQSTDASNADTDLKNIGVETIAMSCFNITDTTYITVVNVPGKNDEEISQTNFTVTDNWYSHPGLSLIQLGINTTLSFNRKQEIFPDIQFEEGSVSTTIVVGGD